jgi:hypothetical protein
MEMEEIVLEGDGVQSTPIFYLPLALSETVRNSPK